MPAGVIIGGVGLMVLLAALVAIIVMAHRAGVAAQAATDAAKSNGVSNAMLDAATRDGHDPAALDRSLRDGSF